MRISYDGGDTWLDVTEKFVDELIDAGREGIIVDVAGLASKGQVKPWTLEQLKEKRQRWRTEASRR